MHKPAVTTFTEPEQIHTPTYSHTHVHPLTHPHPPTRTPTSTHSHTHLATHLLTHTFTCTQAHVTFSKSAASTHTMSICGARRPPSRPFHSCHPDLGGHGCANAFVPVFGWCMGEGGGVRVRVRVREMLLWVVHG